ncbi:hypothetical protein HDV04_002285 [Boothiomyces sp. JEL0838]|nr:hypothetical protein HDV04_002285 [Boothiomyces sp. JEL0838]
MSSDTLSPELGKVGDYSKYVFSIQDSDYSQLFLNGCKSQIVKAETATLEINNSELVQNSTSLLAKERSSLVKGFKKPDSSNQERVIELLEKIADQNEMILKLLKPNELQDKLTSMDNTLVDYFIPRKKNKK